MNATLGHKKYWAAFILLLMFSNVYSENRVIYKSKDGTKVGSSVEKDGVTTYFSKDGTKIGTATEDNPEPNLLRYYGGMVDGIPFFPKLQNPTDQGGQLNQGYGEPKFGK
jgi:hypothetical protein